MPKPEPTPIPTPTPTPVPTPVPTPEPAPTPSEPVNDKVIVEVYAIKDRRFDNRDYEYWGTLSLWETAEQAVTKAESVKGTTLQVAKRQFEIMPSGQVVIKDEVFWEAGQFTNVNYDPRMSNPKYREYLKLKKEFEGEV